MGRVSKFKVGDKVESVVNKFEQYEVIEVLRNELRVRALSNNESFSCKKSLFEVVKQLKHGIKRK